MLTQLEYTSRRLVCPVQKAESAQREAPAEEVAAEKRVAADLIDENERREQRQADVAQELREQCAPLVELVPHPPHQRVEHLQNRESSRMLTAAVVLSKYTGICTRTGFNNSTSMFPP